jgi:hypothetical protein
MDSSKSESDSFEVASSRPSHCANNTVNTARQGTTRDNCKRDHLISHPIDRRLCEGEVGSPNGGGVVEMVPSCHLVRDEGESRLY